MSCAAHYGFCDEGSSTHNFLKPAALVMCGTVKC
uniref:Uncharacterized protein n=1 Tax=Arundo donax TaxID=35708 RepID=A0A0A9HBK6_ARUDO